MKPNTFVAYFVVVFICILPFISGDDGDDDPVKAPSQCEVCKYLTVELKDRLAETGKSKEVLRTGHGIDNSKKRAIAYHKSELRLIEALTDPHICEKILEYNIHKERKGSLRFAKGRSETMDTLHGLVNKGVKVELGIPYDLWDTPSAEVTQLQRQCYHIVEQHEEDIEEWYLSEQKTDLTYYLCRDRVLAKDDKECLEETFVPKVKDDDEKKSETKSNEKEKKKGKKSGKKGEKVKGDKGKGEKVKGDKGKPKKTEL